jgi:hypothetical protein
MKRNSALVIAASLVFLSAFGFAQNTIINFNGGTQGDTYCGGPDGCVETGFYDGTINGVNVGPSQPGGPGMICDDYKDLIYAGETWTASGINVASLNSSNIGNTLFGSTIGLGGYAELAYLVNQMFTTSPSTAQLSAYSQALWYLTGGLTWSSISSTAQSFVSAALSYAKADNYSLSQYANLWLYTPNPKGPGEAQEMWSLVQVPEGSSAMLYLVLSAAVCFGAMSLRKQKLALGRNFFRS